jgi:hypothetical protein
LDLGPHSPAHRARHIEQGVPQAPLFNIDVMMLSAGHGMHLFAGG